MADGVEAVGLRQGLKVDSGGGRAEVAGPPGAVRRGVVGAHDHISANWGPQPCLSASPQVRKSQGGVQIGSHFRPSTHQPEPQLLLDAGVPHNKVCPTARFPRLGPLTVPGVAIAVTPGRILPTVGVFVALTAYRGGRAWGPEPEPECDTRLHRQVDPLALLAPPLALCGLSGEGGRGRGVRG